MLFMDNTPLHDSDNITCPYGIHSIAQEAQKTIDLSPGKKWEPGKWFGPQMISVVLRNICNKRALTNFRIQLCLDNYIFLDEIEKHLNEGNSVLVIIPLMLGMSNRRISSTYLKQVKSLFQIHQTVGMMGGKDQNDAVYVVGDEDI